MKPSSEWPWLDKLMSKGLQKGELSVVGSYPSRGCVDFYLDGHPHELKYSTMEAALDRSYLPYKRITDPVEFPAFSCCDRKLAIELATTHGLSYGHSVLGARWHVGTEDALTRVGIVTVLQPPSAAQEV